ncbi:MAG: DUF2470 domain-containing protein [Pseudomonadota bacterium]
MLDEESVRRIIEHMNDDHSDAVLLYVQAFAKKTNAVSAQLVEFDNVGMGIQYQLDNGNQAECRIDFEEPLKIVEQARPVLVKMVGQARALTEQN